MNVLNQMEALPWFLGALAIVSVFVLFSLSGILVVRRLVSHRFLKAHHDVAGFVYTNLGVLYGVLLGFTVVNAQQHFDEIKLVSEVEASFLTQLYRDAQVFSDKDRETIRQAIMRYGETVVNIEWPSMVQRETSSEARDALMAVWQAYYQLNPSTKQQEIWYAESVGKLNSLMAARLERLMGGVESLGSEMWTLLIVGALIMNAFLWFFGMENLTMHLLMASILASSTAFLLFLIYSLDTAYSGQVTVRPEAFERVMGAFRGGDLTDD